MVLRILPPEMVKGNGPDKRWRACPLAILNRAYMKYQIIQVLLANCLHVSKIVRCN